ncbi:MAG: hypothetical protein OEQ53_01950 [Saprospiraceae bacterium]|nr:hypothetical protein [Saprospiraceae bacterium]
MYRPWHLILLTLFLACQSNDAKLNLVEKDLLTYGIPITIQVPDSAEIKTMDWGMQKDITIISQKDWYSLQLFSSRAGNHNLDAVKAEYLEMAQLNPFFQKVVSEDPDGFVFELQIDSTINYDFRHIKIQGDTEYLFQAGMFGTYSLEQIQQLYEISKLAR